MNLLLSSDLLKYIMDKSLKPVPITQSRPVGASTPVTQVSAPLTSSVQPGRPVGSTPRPSRPQSAKVKAPEGPSFVDIELTDARRIAAQRLTQSKVGTINWVTGYVVIYVILAILILFLR